MNLLIIEDQLDFVARVEESCAGTDVKLLKPDDVGLLEQLAEDKPIEEQLASRMRGISVNNAVDLVLLDTDLSRGKGKFGTQTEYRQACQEAGLPVCRYRKGHTTTKLANLEFIRRLALDSASAVLVPKARLEGDLAETLLPWLRKVNEGFASVRESLENKPELLADQLGPAGILSAILNRPDLKADLLGYTAQNFLFFSPVLAPDVRVASFATQLGYWLHNYILAFPGPILNAGAAAAYLNLQPESFNGETVKEAVEAARYEGPFGSLESYYWREELGWLLESWGGDIAKAPALKNVTLKRVTESPSGVAFFCVLTQVPIREEEAAINPDWIPVGAQLTRIKQSELDELGPMLNI